MDESTLKNLEAHLQKTLSPDLRVQKRKETTDSLELHKNGEFLGVIYIDNDEGELSFQLVMTVLGEDL